MSSTPVLQQSAYFIPLWCNNLYVSDIYFGRFRGPDDDCAGVLLAEVLVEGGIRLCGCGFMYMDDADGPWPEPPGLEDGWR